MERTTVLPPGIAPPLTEDNDHNHNALIVIIASFSMFLAVASLAIRIYASQSRGAVLEDDYVLLLVVIIACTQVSAALTQVHYGWGKSKNLISTDDYQQMMKYPRWQTVCALDIILEIAILAYPVKIIYNVQIALIPLSAIHLIYINTQTASSNPSLDGAYATTVAELHIGLSVVLLTISSLKVFVAAYEDDQGFAYTDDGSKSHSQSGRTTRPGTWRASRPAKDPMLSTPAWDEEPILRSSVPSSRGHDLGIFGVGTIVKSVQYSVTRESIELEDRGANAARIFGFQAWTIANCIPDVWGMFCFDRTLSIIKVRNVGLYNYGVRRVTIHDVVVIAEQLRARRPVSDGNQRNNLRHKSQTTHTTIVMASGKPYGSTGGIQNGHYHGAATEQFRLPKRHKVFHSDSLLIPRHDQYTIAWICALHIEMAAAQAMLDNILEPLPTHVDDMNTYVLGGIKQHKVVIVCLPAEEYGTNNAVKVITNLKLTFSAIRVSLMVGIGGGVPSKSDVRLGDIVVGTRVMQYDLGKIVGDEKFQRTAIPRTPDLLLGTAVSALRSKNELGLSLIPSILQQRFQTHTEYSCPSSPDHLFLAKGICNYSDSHKTKEWKRYAAATAAAYAKELIEELPVTETHVKINGIYNVHQRSSCERGECLLESLRFEQMDTRKLTTKVAYARTCRWLLSHPEYKKWLDPENLTEHHELLWISATYIANRLRVGDRALREELQSKLLTKAAGVFSVFMWVVLVVDIVSTEYRRVGMFLRKRLAEIRSDLSELFKDILKRDNENIESFLLCILWILYAKRPLQPKEFYHALWSGLSLLDLVDDQIPDLNASDASDSKFNRYVISASKGLADVTKSNKQSTVQFIHEYVKDFLTKDKGLYELWPELDFDCESPSHEKLSQCCNHYLIKTELSNEISFLEYANSYILYHANAAANTFPQDKVLSSFPISDWIIVDNVFEKFKIRRYTLDASLLYVLAEKGFSRLIRTRIKEDPEVHVHGERYQYPLFAALANGNKDTVAAILSSSSTILDGVDITEGLNFKKDFRDYENRIPLSWAEQSGRAGIVKLLLRTKTAVNHLDMGGRTSISRASEFGHETVSRLLVDNGADVNISDKDRQHPFTKHPGMVIRT
ncbi:uncharacterized protein KD926_009840 [Aspergillus affinis]|uniref:uncharacterized protein n=1 Tax=Aspergillus affinis TaxID=1070780 RepID=UPI0022FEF8FB|nr:uncharacterized protein KD926_009840 [Aspergillus affinis]KAI9039206.1 hypothetical protein KD926_009840 [Aspergillus affinis]